MTEPTRLTDEALERLRALADAVGNYYVPSDGIVAVDEYLAATHPPVVRALVEEVTRLRAEREPSALYKALHAAMHAVDGTSCTQHDACQVNVHASLIEKRLTEARDAS